MKDETFKYIYAILVELYEAMKSGKKIVPYEISPKRFQIGESYWICIMSELLREEYIRGFSITETKTGRYLSEGWQDSIEITLRGIEYLQNNSMMKKAYALAKEVRDWIPKI